MSPNQQPDALLNQETATTGAHQGTNHKGNQPRVSLNTGRRPEDDQMEQRVPRMTTATEEQNQGQSPHVQLMSTPISMNCHFSASIGHALTAAHRLCRMAETATEKAAEAAQQGRRENAAGESSAGGLYAAHAQATIEQARTDHKNIRRRDSQKLESMEKRAQASDQRASEIHTANASPNARGKKVDATFIAIAIGMRNRMDQGDRGTHRPSQEKTGNLLEILQTCHQLGNLLATHDPGFLTENVDEPTGHRGYDEAGSAAHRQAISSGNSRRNTSRGHPWC